MSKVSISFTKRDLTGTKAMDGYTWAVELLNWRAVGGPWSGRLRATAGYGGEALPRLWSLVDLLRSGVMVKDDQPAWWGYVSAVEIHAPKKPGGRGIVTRVELDSMWNRAMSEYYTFNPGSLQGDRALTAIYENAASILNYGYKERVYPAPRQMTAAQAAYYVKTMLARYGNPVKSLQLREGAESSGYYALVELRGWWESLDWKFYSDARGLVGNLTGGTTFGMGLNAGLTKWAQSFPAGAEAWTASEVWVKLRKEGLPVDNVRVDLMADTAGNPSGVSLANGTYSGRKIGQESDWYKFTLSTPVALTAGASYWVQVSRTGALDASNYYYLMADGDTGWADGRFKYWNGAAWGFYSPEGDLVFQVVGTMDAADQMTRVLAAANCGQFITGAKIESTIGVSSIPFRDGSTRGRQEMELHLATGNASGARLLAKVEPDRLVRVHDFPTVTSSKLVVDDAGKIARRDTGQLQLSENPAGQYVKLGKMATAGAVPGYDGAVFIEACSWSPVDGFHIGEA